MLLNQRTRAAILSALSLSALLGLSACDDGPPKIDGGTTNMLRFEKYCDLEGFSAPLRDTFVVIDSAVLEGASTGNEFVESNRWIRDTVLNLADPANAIARSTAAVRERVTIMLTSEGGSAATPLFTGCIPGYTAEEVAQKRNESGAVTDFFGGGVSEEVESDTETYRTSLVGALINAGKKKAAAGEGSKGGGSGGFLASLTSSVGLLETTSNVPRFVLITRLAKGPLATEEPSREKGIEAGRAVDSPFTGGDIVIVTEDPVPEAQRGFVEGYFLAQDARLIYIGAADVGSLPAAPTTIHRFAGDAIYPDGPGAVQIRVATDTNGKLVSSWLFLRHGDESSIPVDGQAVCADGECSIRSVENGFSQIWSPSRGGEPVFSEDLPFGGLRNLEVTFDDESLKGRIFDPLIEKVGPGPDDKDIPLRAKFVENANF